MSNRFTEKAEKALNNATSVAEGLGHTYIGSEHILLSLLKENDSAASIILAKSSITYAKLLDVVKQYSGSGIRTRLTPKDMTPRCRKIVENSYRISVRYGAMKIGTEHILLSILEEKDSVGVKMLGFVGADIVTVTDEVLNVLRTAEKHFETQKTKKENTESALMQYGKNLTELAKKGKIDPVIGREKETERLIRILCRKTKHNPCLVGEAGVGKTAIVEGLAERIAKGNVPSQIRGKSIISVDLTSMVAGAKYRGDFEERIKSVISEASKNKSIILFIDEIHTIVGAGSAEGAIDAANILKPQLSRAEIQLIGATTFSEYHKYIEKDAALERRFQPLAISEPTKEETKRILEGIRSRYESHHNVIISDEAIDVAVSLSERYIQDRFFPDKAIDLIDEACAKANVFRDEIGENSDFISEKIRQIENDKENAIKNGDYEAAMRCRDLALSYTNEISTDAPREKDEEVVVGANQIKEIITEITGIPISGLSSGVDPRALSEKLKKRVVGQNEAVDALCMSVMRSESGINNPDRPKGVFLFLGPSGVGKTELAKALCEELFLDKKSLIRYDMSEFSEKNSVTMLIGSPPGYVGYEEGGALTEKIRRRPYSVVLFDEIEKANPEVLNLFLQIMDDGVLTDSCGRSASFKNAYIIMTSNAVYNHHGADKNVGFLKSEVNGIKNEKLYEIFTPEFINRIDSIIHFHTLNLSTLADIVTEKLFELKTRLEAFDIDFEYDREIPLFLSKKARDDKLGARAVLRLITSEIENEISSLMLSDELESVMAEIDGEKISIVPNFRKNKSPARMQDSLG